MIERYALVMGVSFGPGLEIVHCLLEENFTVFGCGTNSSYVDHSNFIDLNYDLTNEECVEELYEYISQVTGILDLIVLCPEVNDLGPLSEMSTVDFQSALAKNTLGAFHLLKHSTSFIAEGETHIIQVSYKSLAKSELNSMAATLGAFDGLLLSTKEEWKEMGVRFSTLCFEKMTGGIGELEDFLYVFKMVLNSPRGLSFSQVFFERKEEEF